MFNRINGRIIAIIIIFNLLIQNSSMAMANDGTFCLAPVSKTRDEKIKREMYVSFLRNRIIIAKDEEDQRLLEANNAKALLVSSGKILVAKETAQDSLALLRAIIHEEIEAIMQIIAKEDRYKYGGLKGQILSRRNILNAYYELFPKGKKPSLPEDLLLNDIIANAIELIFLFDEEMITESELSAQELKFIQTIRPIIMAHRHSYFGLEFWDAGVRAEKIRAGINKVNTFYQAAMPSLGQYQSLQPTLQLSQRLEIQLSPILAMGLEPRLKFGIIDLFEELWKLAESRGKIRHYRKHGLNFKYALVNRKDVEDMDLGWVFDEYGYAFSQLRPDHNAQDAYVHARYDPYSHDASGYNTKVCDSAFEYARLMGRFYSFVVEDYFNDFPESYIEYAAVRQYGKRISNDNGHFACTLEFAVAKKEGNLKKYLEWVNRKAFPWMLNEICGSFSGDGDADECIKIHVGTEREKSSIEDMVENFEWSETLEEDVRRYIDTTQTVEDILEKIFEGVLNEDLCATDIIEEAEMTVLERILEYRNTFLKSIRYSIQIRLEKIWRSKIDELSKEFIRICKERNLGSDEDIETNADLLRNYAVFGKKFTDAVVRTIDRPKGNGQLGIRDKRLSSGEGANKGVEKEKADRADPEDIDSKEQDKLVNIGFLSQETIRSIFRARYKYMEESVCRNLEYYFNLNLITDVYGPCYWNGFLNALKNASIIYEDHFRWLKGIKGYKQRVQTLYVVAFCLGFLEYGYLFHGSSINNLENIKEHGLDMSYVPPPNQEVRRVYDIYGRLIDREDRTKWTTDNISFAFSPAIACQYAVNGPEVLTESLRRAATKLKKLFTLSPQDLLDRIGPVMKINLAFRVICARFQQDSGMQDIIKENSAKIEGLKFAYSQGLVTGDLLEEYLNLWRQDWRRLQKIAGGTAHTETGIINALGYELRYLLGLPAEEFYRQAGLVEDKEFIDSYLKTYEEYMRRHKPILLAVPVKEVFPFINEERHGKGISKLLNLRYFVETILQNVERQSNERPIGEKIDIAIGSFMHDITFNDIHTNPQPNYDPSKILIMVRNGDKWVARGIHEADTGEIEQAFHFLTDVGQNPFVDPAVHLGKFDPMIRDVIRREMIRPMELTKLSGKHYMYSEGMILGGKELSHEEIGKLPAYVQPKGDAGSVTLALNGKEITYIALKYYGRAFFVDKELLKQSGHNEKTFLSLLDRAMSLDGAINNTRWEDLPEFVFITCLEKSKYLFEDSFRNHFIGVNPALFEEKDKTARDVMLSIGLVHELRHEIGQTEELPAQDARLTIRILREYGITIHRFRSILSVTHDKGNEYLKLLISDMLFSIGMENREIKDQELDLALLNGEDAEFTKQLLTSSHQGRTYEVRYNALRLSPSQKDLVIKYINLFNEKTSSKMVPIPVSGPKENYLIKITCRGVDKSVGQVNVEGEGQSEDELWSCPLRIIGMMNMAYAASNISGEPSKDDPLVLFIKRQYESITGIPFDEKINIRNIQLKRPEKIDINEVNRLNKLAEELLISA